MKKLFPLLALTCVLGCGKPAGKPSAPTTPAESTPADANQSTGDKVADSLQDISNTIRNVQALTQNVKNIKGLQIVPERINWEYKIINPEDAEISLETRLNNMGNEGWELSASTPKGNFIFKRSKQEKK
jgi:hypothetical protein